MILRKKNEFKYMYSTVKMNLNQKTNVRFALLVKKIKTPEALAELDSGGEK